MPEHAIAQDHVLATLSLDYLGDALERLAQGYEVPIGENLSLPRRHA